MSKDNCGSNPKLTHTELPPLANNNPMLVQPYIMMIVPSANNCQMQVRTAHLAGIFLPFTNCWKKV